MPLGYSTSSRNRTEPKLARIFDPSSGGTGKRLKSASTKLTRITRLKNPSMASDMSDPAKRTMIEKVTAIARFANMPAKATARVPRFSSRKCIGLYGTGLAQPTMYGDPVIKRKSGKRIDPKRSICGNGFSVNRPASRAVVSPYRSAAYPWATSWITIEKISTTR